MDSTTERRALATASFHEKAARALREHGREADARSADKAAARARIAALYGPDSMVGLMQRLREVSGEEFGHTVERGPQFAIWHHIVHADGTCTRVQLSAYAPMAQHCANIRGYIAHFEAGGTLDDVLEQLAALRGDR